MPVIIVNGHPQEEPQVDDWRTEAGSWQGGTGPRDGSPYRTSAGSMQRGLVWDGGGPLWVLDSGNWDDAGVWLTGEPW